MVSGNGKSPAAHETEAKKSPSFNGEIIIPGSPWGSQAQPAPVSMPGSGWGVPFTTGEESYSFRCCGCCTSSVPADTSPSPSFRGEREGPDPHGSAQSAPRGQAPGWEGEVGGVTNRLVGPPPGTARRAGRPGATLSPRPAVGEGKGRVVRATLRRQIFEKPVLPFPPTALRLRREIGVRRSASVGRLRHQRLKSPRRWKTITIRLLFHGRETEVS
jgi:hypothetical protein